MNKLTAIALGLTVIGALGSSAWAADPGAPGGRGPSEAKHARMEACRADPQKCREEARARFERRFKKADSDGSGALSREEAQKGMPKLARRFGEIDANGNGQITLDEIRSARKAEAEKRRQMMQERRQQMEQQKRS